MTPEQASKLRKEDRILVEMVVGPPPPNLGALAETVVLAGVAGEMARPIPMSAIHSILPRPLEAGDRVIAPRSHTIENRTATKMAGKIIATHEGLAWIDTDSKGWETVWPLSDLRRVEDQ